MNNLEVFIVEEQSNDRIDKFLAQEMEMYSRSYIQKLLKDGLVSVNGIIVKANYKVSPDDRIEVQIPELQEPDIVPEDIPLDILYEDEDILIVNKPKGMVVHPAAGHYSHTLVNAVLYHCQVLMRRVIFANNERTCCIHINPVNDPRTHYSINPG